MRILMIGRFEPGRWVRFTTEELFGRAFEALGCRVYRCEIRSGKEAALNAAASYDADWVFVSKDFGMDERFVRKLREVAPESRFAHWHFDSMFALGKLKWYERIAPLFDVAFTKEEGLIERFRNKGINAIYFDQGIDPDVTKPGLFRESLASEVGFLGTFYGKDERTRLLRAVSERFRLRIWSQKHKKWREAGFSDVSPPMFDELVGDICSSVKVLLGINITHEVSGYWSNRQYIVTGAGGFYLCKYTRGLERVFENGKHIVWFEETEEALRLIERYLAEEDERRKIAESGMRLTRTKYTYRERAKEMLEVLESL